jgi:hypothetical protein
MSQVKILILAAFPIYFIALWCFILWMIALIGGWRKLAASYHDPRDFQGQTLRFQSAQLNWSNYRNILHLGLTERGLHLVPMVLFRPFHRPLFIPWEEIVAEPIQRTLFGGYQLSFRSAPGVKMTLYQNTFEHILDFLRDYPDRLNLEAQPKDV